ncbi:hypothetical protein L2E82_02878 [Cichorium intybus]|uniref:Uncharacterized protein n=1 Tax=Cichorium intybus TaxID=13427 RepID=A0ACB9H2W6_CICIN|nr:hypothetical protein L2E82_02878 [Cichorium intybus]
MRNVFLSPQLFSLFLIWARFSSSIIAGVFPLPSPSFHFTDPITAILLQGSFEWRLPVDLDQAISHRITTLIQSPIICRTYKSIALINHQTSAMDLEVHLRRLPNNHHRKPNPNLSHFHRHFLHLIVQDLHQVLFLEV